MSDIIELAEILLYTYMGQGWRISGPYNKSALITTVAGATPLGSSVTVKDICDDSLAAGTGVIITGIQFFSLSGIGNDFFFGQLAVNGVTLSELSRIEPTYTPEFQPYSAVILPGSMIQFQGQNFSGTDPTLVNFPDKTDVQVRAALRGFTFTGVTSTAVSAGAGG